MGAILSCSKIRNDTSTDSSYEEECEVPAAFRVSSLSQRNNRKNVSETRYCTVCKRTNCPYLHETEYTEAAYQPSSSHETKHWNTSTNFSSSPLPPRPPLSSHEKEIEVVAAAFSIISGVKIISENEAKIKLKLGKKVRAIDIKDVFYKGPDFFWDGEGSKPLYYIPDSAYDPRYDYDFTDYQEEYDECTRGDYPYERPAGWKRKAVNVLGKYRGKRWLGQEGWRNESSPGEWPVSYHGTEIKNVSKIVTKGYDIKKSVRQLYGKGIYSTPSPKVAEQYATKFNYKGKNYKCILQNRVDLEKTEEVETPDDGIYFVTPNDKNIRPYGVCLKEI